MNISTDTGKKPTHLRNRRPLSAFTDLHSAIGMLFLSLALPLLAQENQPEVPEALPTTRVKRKVVIRSEADKQSAGRQSLTGDQIKYAPATFGDSLNAFTTLPGVMRTDVLFGGLVIRGRGDNANRYFVDGIPIPRPQHFGGLHSVLNTDIVKEANIYASAAPARFGGITGAVLEFQTIDEVDEFGGVVDVGLLSANFLLKSPWSGGENRPGGYWITAARVGYLPLIVPPVYEWVTGQPILALPQYYDYQVKGRLTLDKKDEHRLTLLALGSYDIVTVQRLATGFEQSFSSDLNLLRSGARWEAMSHSQGLYYDYEPSRKLKNNLLIFNTLILEKSSYPSSLVRGEDEYSRRYPHQAGIKNTFTMGWLNGMANLKIGMEYTLYYFFLDSRHFTFVNSPNRIETLIADRRKQHHVPGGYVENAFQFGAWKFIPGIRADVLPLSGYTAVGPRMLVGWEIYPGTSIEAAGGVYQSFIQVNPEYTSFGTYDFSGITDNAGLEPEESIHRSLAIARKYILWEIKIEGYWNSYYRALDYRTSANRTNIYGNHDYGQNFGGEFSIRKAPADNGGLYGWASYTLSRNEEGRFLSRYDQTHNFKLVAGYLFGTHTISARVDVYSGFPYTPIVGSYYYSSGQYPQHIPQSASTYSAHFPIAHRISLRYGQERKTRWGSWRWYVEVVNATNYAPIGIQSFDYSRPYEPGVNPTLEPLEPKIPILPNFGVEVRF